MQFFSHDCCCKMKRYFSDLKNFLSSFYFLSVGKVDKKTLLINPIFFLEGVLLALEGVLLALEGVLFALEGVLLALEGVLFALRAFSKVKFTLMSWLKFLQTS